MGDSKIKKAILEYLYINRQDFYSADQLKGEIPDLLGVMIEDVEFLLKEMLNEGYVEHPDNVPHSQYRISTKGRKFYKGGGYPLEEVKKIVREEEDRRAAVKQQEREKLEDKKLRLEIRKLYRERLVWIPMLILLLGNIVQLLIDFWN